ncbi:bifunctional UDP-sugar hydrolase/5'-nucleotidase [Taklimakanibacter lacteus]|uniref:bifunctional UDP-sugar hydrolase/5'-nucleotidase n=1 Tax=Taklimakanibacter lacteus TaxID=2268456 RepID=UPI0034D64C17
MRSLSKLVCAMALMCLASMTAFAEQVTITFIQTNDIDKFEGSGERGGFARLNAVVSAERAKGGHVVYGHAGDMISPSLLSGLDKGEHTIMLTNLVPPDAFTPGNHEYDFGPDIFLKRMSEAKFPLIAANLRDAEGKPVKDFTDTLMIERGPVKIGIVGLTSDESYHASSPGNLKIANALETGLAKARELRDQGADFVVALTHSGHAEDRAMYDSRLFDLIMTGHDQDLLINYDGRTAMMESYEQADFVTIADIAFDISEKDGKRTVKWRPSFRVIDTRDVTPDPETKARTDELAAMLAKELDVAIGTTTTALDSRRATVRTGEAAMGNLVADALREAVNADVAITNGGGLRGNKEYPAGHALTRKDVLTELPFGNRTMKLQVSGATLLAALENGFSEIEDGGGRFPQVSGLKVEYDAGKPKGQRVVAVEANGKPLDVNAKYTLATNDFMANGGDGYVVFREAKPLLTVRDAKLMANDLMAYVTARKTISPSVEGRIVKK